MWGREVLLISFALIALGTTTKCPKRKTSPIREILCYTSTHDVRTLTDSVCGCTSLVHQHHDMRNISVSHIVDLRKSLKEMHPSLQFVISIHDPAMTLKNSTVVRQEAIARIISVIKEVDGVELSATAGSKERLYNFIKGLRDEMIRKSYDKRIFLALPNKPEDLAKQFDLKELVKYIDLFTLSTDYMTDEDGTFVTFHPSRLMGLFDVLNTDSLVDLISELGAPKEKITMTLPASAYRFALKRETENAPRSETTEKEPTSIDRKQLCEATSDGEWTVERDEDLTAPYAFQNKTWIAYEDKISVGIKAKYALLRDLAGLAVRDIENDIKTECEKPLTEEIHRSFTEFRRKSRQAVLNALEDELHQTQFSYPNRARTSSFRVVRVVDTEGHIRAVRENTQTEFVCRRQGYFVHPKSCNRFYRCVKFNQAIEDYSVFEFDCPAGLSFDERTEVCVWPGSLPQGSPCPGSSEIAPVAPKRFECSQPGYYADPQNCRWFFACMDLGESELMAFEFRCPYGLVFDEKRLVCEWPWLVPACSESGSAYTRTEYSYGGHTVAGGSTGVISGGYVTGALPEYSVTAGTGRSNVDYSGTTGTGVHGVNYFAGSTAGYAGSSGSIDYSRPSGYGNVVSSVPTYTGRVVPVSSTGQGNKYFASSDTRYTASTGRGIDGYSGGYVGPSSAGIPTGYSGSTAGGYSGIVGGDGFAGAGGVTYSGRPESIGYSTTGGYSERVGGVAGSATYPKTSGYFASTEPSGSVNVRGGFDSGFGSTNLYAGSGASRADGHSQVSTGIYPGPAPGHRPAFDKTGSSFGVGSSYSGSIGESTSKIHQGSAGYGAGYSKATSGILQGSTSSDRVSATDFDASKSVTSGISAVSGRTGVTIADGGRFVNGGPSSPGATDASSTRVRYKEEEEYTVPVFLIHGEPIYPFYGTTGSGTKDHDVTSGVVRDHGRVDLTRPNLNISIFGQEVPTGYEVQKGVTSSIATGSDGRGNFFTGDSTRTVLGYGTVPTISYPVGGQGAILTGGPEYVAPGTSGPGYVTRDESRTAGLAGSAGPGTLIHGSPTPAISVSGPSTSGIVIPGRPASGMSTGSSVQSGIIESSTGKSYVSQTGTSYRGISGATRGCSSGVRPRPQGYETDPGCATEAVNVAYDTGRYSESDVPDYRPTSATLPDSIVSGNRIEEGAGGVAFDSTSRGSITNAPGYPLPTSAVFTPSGFTKTGLTRTGITTAVLGGGGSYSVTTSERRPAPNPENISEKAFEGNVAGYTRTSSSSGDVAEPTQPGRFSTASPISRVQSVTPGYSYPTPSVQLGTDGVTFTSSSISPSDLPFASSPRPFSRINVYDASFGSKIPTAPSRSPTIPSAPVYATERPGIYETNLFEAAKIPSAGSTVGAVVDAGYRTVPTTIPFLTDDRFVQRTGSSRTTSTSSSSGAFFQRTDSSGEKDYGPSSEYLPARPTGPSAIITSTGRYDAASAVSTARPDLVGVTYKKPSPFEGPSSFPSPTTFRPSSGYYSSDRGFSGSSAGTVTDSGSPTNLNIPREEIGKLITNYDRGTAKYVPSVYDITASSGFGSTVNRILSTSGKSSFPVVPASPTTTTSSYEVTTRSPEGKGKVIVKWSDLHPLLLSKLGAECTCRADPFATLRGPVRKLIDSSRGKVDLANYGSSEIYVDLENGGSSSEEEGDTISYDAFPAQPYKISPHETTSDSPSSSYLPVPSTTIRTRDFGRSIAGSRGSQAGGSRNDRRLKDDVVPSTNSITRDPEDDSDEIINGATDCARPGLFRHPSLCNKFYACHWDQWKKKFTLHVFNCPIHLTFDSKASACNWPSKGPACQADILLV